MIRQVGTITLRYLSSRGQHHRRHHSTFSAASPSQHHHSATALCLASFIAAASAVTATADGKGDGQELNNDTTAATAFSTAKNHPLNVSKCEVNTPPSPSPSPPTAETASTHKPLSLLRRLIYPHSYLPTPRLLTPQDTVFSYPSLTRGLIQRQKDEQRLCNLLSSTQVVKLRTNNNNNQEKQQQLLQEMNTIIYGVGITSQMRQQFIIQFGCTGYTPDILHHLVTNYADRGIIEIGAGHGQWARALYDHYQKMKNDETDITAADGINNEEHNNSNNGGHHPHRQTRHQTRHSWMLHENKFIVAYDSKESLPLSSSSLSSMSETTTSTSRASSLQTSVLPPTQEEIKSYFYNNVRTVNNIEAVTKYAHGRVLLLVYPPPGSMAIDTIHAYINATNNPSNLNHHPNRKHHHHNQYHDDESSNNSSDWKNDIVIYVGEGRGGANANDEFFDYFLGISNNNTSSNKKSSSGSWVLEKVMTVKSCPGGKGYEKLFILQRV